MKFAFVKAILMSVLRFETARLVEFGSRIIIFIIWKTVSCTELL